MSNPILDLVAKELADANEDLIKSLDKLAREATNVDRLTADEIQRLGEHTLEEGIDRSGALGHAAYDSGYTQACEDILTVLTAYQKGLN